MPASEISETDCKALAIGYLTRARSLVARLEARRGFPFEAAALVVLPPMAAALPTMESGKKLPLQICALLLGIAAAVFKDRDKLTDGAGASKKARLESLIADLEGVTRADKLDAWHRQVVDEAGDVIKRFMEVS